MGRYSKEDIFRIVEEEDVEFIRLQFTDAFGVLKNMAITASQLEKALDNEMMFDGASIDGFVRIEESDMYLYPDIDSFEIFPWRPQQGKVARFICDVYKADRTPFEGDPRYIFKKVLAEAAEMGYTFNVGPECEFFLFDSDEQGKPSTNSDEQAGYFDLGPNDYGENARRDMVMTLEDMGFVIEASHHEAAPAQHEIDFKYAEGLKIADDIMTFKLVVKTIAKRHGMYATFMPKPREGINGSGMHINMSLSKNGTNAFFEESDENGLSETAYQFIAGILEHIDAMTLVCNPLVNSYKRLVPGYEAPVYEAWSATNRSPLVRIPAARGKGTRAELRSPDPSSNPYLALAVCLAAGLDGIKRQLKVPESVKGNIYAMTDEEREALGIKRLPANLNEAAKALEKDEFIKNVLGAHVTDAYLENVKKEWAEFSSSVSAWEINKYLYKY